MTRKQKRDAWDASTTSHEFLGWHRWFAWYPVITLKRGGVWGKVWLCYVWRKAFYSLYMGEKDYKWRYFLIDPASLNPMTLQAQGQTKLQTQYVTQYQIPKEREE